MIAYTKKPDPNRISPTYVSWRAMMQRCNYKKAQAYRWYGARGISVCKEWNDFSVFLRDMGERPPGYSIDRIDPNGNYTPQNCRWASRAVQLNNRRHVKKLTHDGVTMCMSAWSRRLGVSVAALSLRIKNGLPLERVLARGDQRFSPRCA